MHLNAAIITTIRVVGCSFSRVVQPVNELDMLLGKDLAKVGVTDTYHHLLHATRVDLRNFDCAASHEIGDDNADLDDIRGEAADDRFSVSVDH